MGLGSSVLGAIADAFRAPTADTLSPPDPPATGDPIVNRIGKTFELPDQRRAPGARRPLTRHQRCEVNRLLKRKARNRTRAVMQAASRRANRPR